jgi:hypothetical protein
MTITLDPKSAKRIVTGLLKEEHRKVAESIKEANAVAKANVALRAKTRSATIKLSKFQTEIENKVVRSFGDSLIYAGWYKRMLQCYVLEPIPPTDEQNRPVFGLLVVHSYNSRSGHMTSKDILEVSTHFMERLITRKKDTRLLTLFKEEFTWNFFNEYCGLMNTWWEGGCLRQDMKVPTTNGTACIVFPMGIELPVLTTWYP